MLGVAINYLIQLSWGSPCITSVSVGGVHILLPACGSWWLAGQIIKNTRYSGNSSNFRNHFENHLHGDVFTWYSRKACHEVKCLEWPDDDGPAARRNPLEGRSVEMKRKNDYGHLTYRAKMASV